MIHSNLENTTGARGSPHIFFVIYYPIKLKDPDGRDDEYFDYNMNLERTVKSDTNYIYRQNEPGGKTYTETEGITVYGSRSTTPDLIFGFDAIEKTISTAGTISSIPPNTAKMAGMTLGTGLKILDTVSFDLSLISFGIDGFQFIKTPTLSNGIDLAISTVGLFGLAGAGVSLMMQGGKVIAPHIANEAYKMQSMMMDYEFEMRTGIPNFSQMVGR